MAKPTLLTMERAERLFRNLTLAESHLAQACAAVAAEAGGDQSALHQRVSALLVELESLNADLQPAVFLEDKPAAVV